MKPDMMKETPQSEEISFSVPSVLVLHTHKPDPTRVQAVNCDPLSGPTCRISRLLPMPSSVQTVTTCSGLQHPVPSSSRLRTLWPTAAISREGAVERPECSSGTGRDFMEEKLSVTKRLPEL